MKQKNHKEKMTNVEFSHYNIFQKQQKINLSKSTFLNIFFNSYQKKIIKIDENYFVFTNIDKKEAKKILTTIEKKAKLVFKNDCIFTMNKNLKSDGVYVLGLPQLENTLKEIHLTYIQKWKILFIKGNNFSKNIINILKLEETKKYFFQGTKID